MKQLYTGIGIKNISKSNIDGIKIPVPSIEKQNEIVEYCEFNDNLIKQLESEIDQNKKLAKEFVENVIKSSKVIIKEDIATEDNIKEDTTTEDIINEDD